LAAFMTAFYISRVMFMTFHGEPRAGEEVMHHAHESPWVMRVPLLVLAAGAALAGYFAYKGFVGEEQASFWKSAILVLPDHAALAQAEQVPLTIAYLPLVAGVFGIAMAYGFYIVNPTLPERLAANYRALYQFLLNRWYFDELYDSLFVRSTMAIGDGLWKSGDGAVIDGLGPDGVAAVTRDLARQASRLQTGYLYHYAFAMMIGLVAIVTWYLSPWW
jgi:NADH-quinone oxidoreductase subunit L